MKSSVVFPLVVPSCVLAFPLSHATAKVAPAGKTSYIPLVVVVVSLVFVLLVFLTLKLVYMKHRRIGTIHAPLGVVRSVSTRSNLSSSTSNLGFRGKDKREHQHRGLWVGCLGSPTWETSITSQLVEATRRRDQGRKSPSFVYPLHAGSIIPPTAHSTFARSKSKHSSLGSRPTESTVFTGCASDADRHVLHCSYGPSRSPTLLGSSPSETLSPMLRSTSTKSPSRYGDFGESHDVRLPGGSLPRAAARRASPSSIRLVDGLSQSNQVEYSFLSGLPPNAIVVSPPMGTRDSFQLSKCSLKYTRKPVPPLPSLPSFLPSCLPQGSETRGLPTSDYLPPLHFSPLASIIKAFHSPQRATRSQDPDPRRFESASHASSKVSHPSSAESAASSSTIRDATLHSNDSIQEPNMKSNHKESQSYKNIVIGGSPSRMILNTDGAATLLLEDKRCRENESIGVLRSSASCNGGAISRKPLKSCLRQKSSTPLIYSPGLTFTPSPSEARYPPDAGNQVSLRTPISDIDIGILGLDRFRWNDEVKELQVRSCHMKKDSVALVPFE